MTRKDIEEQPQANLDVFGVYAVIRRCRNSYKKVSAEYARCYRHGAYQPVLFSHLTFEVSGNLMNALFKAYVLSDLVFAVATRHLRLGGDTKCLKILCLS